MRRCKASVLFGMLLVGGCECSSGSGMTYKTPIRHYQDGAVHCYYTDAFNPVMSAHSVSPAISCVVVSGLTP